MPRPSLTTPRDVWGWIALAVAVAVVLAALPLQLFPDRLINFTAAPVLLAALIGGPLVGGATGLLVMVVTGLLGWLDPASAVLLAAAPVLGWAHRRGAHPAYACLALPLVAGFADLLARGAIADPGSFWSQRMLQALFCPYIAYLLSLTQLRLFPRISQGMGNRPLAHWLFLVLATLASVLATALGIWSAYDLQQRLRSEAQGQVSKLAYEVSDSADVLLTQQAVSTAAFARVVGLQGISGSTVGLSQMLDAFASKQGGILTMLVAASDGRIVAAASTRADLAVGKAIGNSVADRDYFRNVLDSGTTYISNAFVGRGFGNDLIVAVSAPIPDPNGRTVGVLETSLDVSQLAQLLQATSTRRGYGIVLSDRSGLVVASRGDQVPSAGTDYSSPLDTMVVSPRGVRDMPRWIAASATLPAVGWLVNVRQPYTEVATLVDQQLRQVALNIAISLTTVLLLSIWLANVLSRPLARLARLIRGADKRTSVDALQSVQFAPREVRRFALALVRAERRNQRARRRLEQGVTERNALNEDLRRALADLDAKVAARTRVLAEREIQLRGSEARWRNMAEIAPDAVVVIDDDSQIIFANSAFQRMAGMEGVALVGRSLSMVVPERMRRAHTEGFGRYLRTGKAKLDWRMIELPMVRADGAELTAEVSFGEFQQDGRRYFVGYLRDISERKQQAVEMKRAREAAESANRAKDTFLATMSHEIRTPLHGLIGTLDLLAREKQLPDKAAERLAIARNSARSLLQLANDVLDLGGIEAGRLRIERVGFDLRELVGSVVGGFEPDALAKGLRITSSIAADAPGWVVGDPLRLRQILGNLVNNAIKFTESGKVSLRVTQEGDGVAFAVTDTGIGVPPDQREQIFERFTQVEGQRSRRYGGVGLGLAISRLLAGAMGGELVLVESSPGGSTFRLRLPLLETPRYVDATVGDQPAPLATDAAQRPRVIVVDDNPANRYVVEAYLDELGAEAVLCDGADACIRELQAGTFDMVLMDIQMPVKDGYEATREIREALGLVDLPILAITANANLGERERCNAAGMDDLLTKPFDATQLRAAMAKHLGGRNAAPVVPRVIASSDGLEPLLDTHDPQSLAVRFAKRPESLQRLFGALQDSIETHLAGLREPGSKTATELVPTLHGLKGASGMYGAKRLQRAAARLENELLAERPPGELLNEFVALEAVGRATLDEVRALLERLAAGPDQS